MPADVPADPTTAKKAKKKASKAKQMPMPSDPLPEPTEVKDNAGTVTTWSGWSRFEKPFPKPNVCQQDVGKESEKMSQDMPGKRRRTRQSRTSDAPSASTASKGTKGKQKKPRAYRRIAPNTRPGCRHCHNSETGCDLCKDLILGCASCRGCSTGCGHCRQPEFKGQRGKQASSPKPVDVD